jgi:hypothetical protein
MARRHAGRGHAETLSSFGQTNAERESGIQLAGQRTGSLAARPTERPTVYMRAVRIAASAVPATSAGPAAVRTTLRLRLTPYAREHARADGDTDDTPGVFLRLLSSIGSVHAIASVGVLDPRVEYDDRERSILSLVDGVKSLGAILDSCPMPMHCALRILKDLSSRGVVTFR